MTAQADSLPLKLYAMVNSACPQEVILRILIVDDHEIVRRGVRSLLTAQPNLQVCGEAVDGRDAVQKAQDLQPDAIVMDINMPNLNGLEASREIRRFLPRTKIVVLSQHNLPEMIKQAFSAGANGYVVKSAISTELVAALEKDSLPTDRLPSAPIDVDIQEILQRSAVFEQALRETGERLRLAQEAAQVGTFEFNVKTGLHRWTPELEALYGLQPGTFPGSDSAWKQLIHPEDRLTTVRALDSAVRTGRFESEWRVIWHDGSVHWLLGRACLFSDKAGRPERWVGVNIDITERKFFEETRLLDRSFDAIVVRDAGDCVRYWSRGAQELYGWSAEEAFGHVTHTLLQIAFPESLEKVLAILRTRGRWEGELTHSCKNGRRVTVLSRWGLIHDWESGQQWVLETNTDITERRGNVATNKPPA
jgi:PAS domain S-box-containing protein